MRHRARAGYCIYVRSVVENAVCQFEKDSTGSLLDAMPLPDDYANDGREQTQSFSRPMGTPEQDNRPDSLLNSWTALLVQMTGNN